MMSGTSSFHLSPSLSSAHWTAPHCGKQRKALVGKVCTCEERFIAAMRNSFESTLGCRVTAAALRHPRAGLTDSSLSTKAGAIEDLTLRASPSPVVSSHLLRCCFGSAID